jgi:hypothetical protein
VWQDCGREIVSWLESGHWRGFGAQLLAPQLRTTPVPELIAGTSSISKHDMLMRNISLSEMHKYGTFFE